MDFDIERYLETSFASVDGMADGLAARIPSVIVAVLVGIFILVLFRVIRAGVTAGMKRAHARPALRTLARNLLGIAGWIVALAVFVTIIFPSITPSNLLAGIGLTSVAVGFAFKDVFENFLAGIFILGREKMQIGDVIEVEDVRGRVEEILIRETWVRELDGELVILPNAYLFQNPVTIETDNELSRRELVIGVDYDTDLKQAKEVMERAVAASPGVSHQRPVEAQITGFGGSSIDFTVYFWSSSEPAKRRAAIDVVAYALKEALDEAGITIPFPQTTLSLREEVTPLPVSSGAPARSGGGRGEA